MFASNTTRRYWLGGIVILLIVGLSWFGWPDEERPLQPFRHTPTPANTLNSEPVLLTFETLNADPLKYHNQRLRVSGNYHPQALPSCDPFNGPIIQWALIGEELQLYAQGYEGVLSRVTPGTNLTVDGIWRLYSGPVGCGKQPARGTIWYLTVERIVQPNPLVAMGFTPGAPPPLNGQVTPIGLLPTSTPTLLPGQPSPTTAVPLTLTVTIATTTTTVATPTRFTTPIPGTVVTTVAPTATVGTAVTRTSTPTPTRPPGNVTPTRTPTPTSTRTPGSPVPPTATQPGYPGPQATATPTISLPTPAYP